MTHRDQVWLDSLKEQHIRRAAVGIPRFLSDEHESDEVEEEEGIAQEEEEDSHE